MNIEDKKKIEQILTQFRSEHLIGVGGSPQYLTQWNFGALYTTIMAEIDRIIKTDSIIKPNTTGVRKDEKLQYPS